MSGALPPPLVHLLKLRIWEGYTIHLNCSHNLLGAYVSQGPVEELGRQPSAVPPSVWIAQSQQVKLLV